MGRGCTVRLDRFLANIALQGQHLQRRHHSALVLLVLTSQRLRGAASLAPLGRTMTETESAQSVLSDRHHQLGLHRAHPVRKGRTPLRTEQVACHVPQERTLV